MTGWMVDRSFQQNSEKTDWRSLGSHLPPGKWAGIMEVAGCVRCLFCLKSACISRSSSGGGRRAWLEKSHNLSSQHQILPNKSHVNVCQQKHDNNHMKKEAEWEGPSASSGNHGVKARFCINFTGLHWLGTLEQHRCGYQEETTGQQKPLCCFYGNSRLHPA